MDGFLNKISQYLFSYRYFSFNEMRTDEILCGVDENETALGEPVAIDAGTSFSTLCSLLALGELNIDGNTVDLRAYLNSANEHTIFAPTNAAFAKIQSTVDEVLALQTTNAVAFNRIIVGWLQLHILPDLWLDTDLDCEEVYQTINLSTSSIFNQRQKTKCKDDAAYFDQIGVGNIGDADLPTVGLPADVFLLSEFNTPATVLKKTVDGTGFSSNVIGCNGVIHVVDTPLLPSDHGQFRYGYGGHSYKGSKGGYRYGYGGHRYRYGYRYGGHYHRNLNEDGSEAVGDL